MAYGDSAHKHLLASGWQWDGVHYRYEVRTPTLSGEVHDIKLDIRPEKNPHDPIKVIRRGVWLFYVGTHLLGRHRNLPNAALAVLGDAPHGP